MGKITEKHLNYKSEWRFGGKRILAEKRVDSDFGKAATLGNGGKC